MKASDDETQAGTISGRGTRLPGNFALRPFPRHEPNPKARDGCWRDCAGAGVRHGRDTFDQPGVARVHNHIPGIRDQQRRHYQCGSHADQL